MGINSVLLGHAETAIDNAAINALRNGQNLSRPTPLELDAAEAALEVFPSFDMVKFAKNGSDANSGAIRLARAITGRQLVAYDGSAPFLAIHDWFIGNTVMGAGVPEAISSLAVPFRFDDLTSLGRVFAEHPGQIAAVIMEPCRERRPEPAFLPGVRKLCQQHGTLLIFDEVVTGFRYGLHGVHTLLNVEPDLISIGKGLANGYSLTALLGKREYMERGGLQHGLERVFLLSTTNGAEQSALAAGLATIRFYQEHDVIGHLYAVGRRIMEGLNEASARHGIARHVKAFGDFSCRPAFSFTDADDSPSPELRTLFLQELIEAGVFMPWLCPSFRHGEPEITQTLDAFERACKTCVAALETGSTERFLTGPAVKPVFRKYN